MESEIFRGASPSSIVALQEMDETLAHSWLAPLADQRGLKMIYAKKASGESQDGCALLIDRQLWRVCEHGCVVLGPPSTATSQVALVALLESLASSKCTLLVASVHLKSKPGHEERRRDQVRVLLAALERMSTKAGGVTRILVLGDFNDVPSSLACELMRETGFTSIYDTHYPHEFYTTAKKREHVVQRTIDYMWLKEAKAGGAATSVVSLLEIPPVSTFPHLLPCTTYPSDHLALVAQLQL